MRTPFASISSTSSVLALGLLAAVAQPAAFQAAHAAAVQFVSAPNRIDIAYDDARDLLYITSGDQMLRYQLSTSTFQTPVTISGASLEGMDLSPDGSTAAIADTVAGASDNYVHLVNLDTLAVNTVDFPLDGAAGTFTVAYGKDGDLVVSCEFNGSGFVPLWLYDPKTGAETNLGTVSQDTMLRSSPGGRVVAIAESNDSGGPFGYYAFKSGTLDTNGGTGWFNYEIGVNKDATIYAIPTYGGTFIANQDLALTGTVIGTYAGQQPVAAAFHPTKHLVYFPFAGTNNVEVYNTKTWAQVKSYDFGTMFGSNGNYAFVDGRSKLSKDGSLLFVTVTGGVGYVPTTK